MGGEGVLVDPGGSNQLRITSTRSSIRRSRSRAQDIRREGGQEPSREPRDLTSIHCCDGTSIITRRSSCK